MSMQPLIVANQLDPTLRIPTGGTSGFVLSTNGSGTYTWVSNISGSTTLAGLSDVNIPSPNNGDVLTYNSSTSKWINSVISGTGTVTSVALTVPSILSISGSPITTNGTIIVSLATQTAATIFAGPLTGSAAIPTFRALASTDIPALAYISSLSNTNILGGTGITTSGTLTSAGGSLTITNSGVTSITVGSGLSTSGASGALTLANTGVTALAGTANQITASASTGSVTLSLPVSIVTPGSLQIGTFLQVSATNTITAAGTNQGTATALTADYNVVTTVGAGQGVVLPTAASGKTTTIVNVGANALQIYPASGASIDSLGTNIAMSLPVNQVYCVRAISSTQWYTILPVFSAGTAMSVSRVNGIITYTNTGVTSLIAGTGISVSSAAGAVTITNTTDGTVTSISVADNSTTPIYSIGGSPITISGTIGFTLNTQTKNLVFAGPTTGSAAQPTFRTLTTGDLPAFTTNSFLYSGTAGVLTATSAPTNGQLLIGSTSAAPVVAALTSAQGIGITNGAGSITIGTIGDWFDWGDGGSGSNISSGSSNVSGVSSIAGTASQITASNSAGAVTLSFSLPAKAIIVPSSGINTAETYISANTFVIPASTMAVGDVYMIYGFGTCTSTAANLSTFTPRCGTAGTTADTALSTVTCTAASSGTTIAFYFEITITVQAIGTLGSLFTSGMITNTGITGISSSSTPVVVIGGTTTINTTNTNILGISYKTAASTTTSTFQQVVIRKVM